MAENRGEDTGWDEAEDFLADVVQIPCMLQVVEGGIGEIGNLRAQSILNILVFRKKIQSPR